jgi:hypothetical protein
MKESPVNSKSKNDPVKTAKKGAETSKLKRAKGESTKGWVIKLT